MVENADGGVCAQRAALSSSFGESAKLIQESEMFRLPIHCISLSSATTIASPASSVFRQRYYLQILFYRVLAAEPNTIIML